MVNKVGIIEKLEKIGKKYGLYEKARDLLVNREYIKLWYEKTRALRENSVVVFGGGGGARILMQMLIGIHQDEKVAYIVDRNADNHTSFLEKEVHNSIGTGISLVGKWGARFILSRHIHEIQVVCRFI